jgi:hypothetical protein
MPVLMRVSMPSTMISKGSNKNARAGFGEARNRVDDANNTRAKGIIRNFIFMVTSLGAQGLFDWGDRG